MNSDHPEIPLSRGAVDLRPNPDVIAQRTGDECVLVHMRTDRIYALNRTGARVWELLCAGCGRLQVRERMLEEFEGDAARMASEIDELFTTLQSEDLVMAQARV